MYLVDTCVVSEARKQSGAHPGVRAFLQRVIEERAPVYLSVITVGELRRGIETIRGRSGAQQAGRLERWLDNLLATYPEQVLGIDIDTAQLWGAIPMPAGVSPLDRQIAATARIHDLTLVTRKTQDFSDSGVATFNPFLESGQ
jgi:predicted nucleic acid-binding protein